MRDWHSFRTGHRRGEVGKCSLCTEQFAIEGYYAALNQSSVTRRFALPSVTISILYRRPFTSLTLACCCCCYCGLHSVPITGVSIDRFTCGDFPILGTNKTLTKIWIVNELVYSKKKKKKTDVLQKYKLASRVPTVPRVSTHVKVSDSYSVNLEKKQFEVSFLHHRIRTQ